MEFEIKIIEFLQAGRTPFFDQAFQIISLAGSVVGFVGMLIFFLCFRKKLAFWSLFTYGFVYLSVNTLKLLVARTRPFNISENIENIGDIVHEFSFPSGHIACATTIAIFLGYFLFEVYKKPSTRVLAVLCLCMYVFLVGLSRMYLGKHYLTDLLGGIAVAGLICTLGIVLMILSNKNRSVSNETKIEDEKSE